MTDRGFDIEESLALYCANMKILSFTKGKRKLSSLELEQSRLIVAVRIDAERLIGIVPNKNSLFQRTLSFARDFYFFYEKG